MDVDPVLELDPLYVKTALKALYAKQMDVIVIDTDPAPSTEAGGTWWDVAVPEVSARESVKAARASYMAGRKRQSKGDA